MFWPLLSTRTPELRRARQWPVLSLCTHASAFLVATRAHPCQGRAPSCNLAIAAVGPTLVRVPSGHAPQVVLDPGGCLMKRDPARTNRTRGWHHTTRAALPAHACIQQRHKVATLGWGVPGSHAFACCPWAHLGGRARASCKSRNPARSAPRPAPNRAAPAAPGGTCLAPRAFQRFALRLARVSRAWPHPRGSA